MEKDYRQPTSVLEFCSNIKDVGYQGYNTNIRFIVKVPPLNVKTIDDGCLNSRNKYLSGEISNSL